MDPFSIAASIIAVLQLSGKVSSLCFDLYTTFGARKELDQIIDGVESLRSILQKLARIPIDNSANSRACTDPALSKPIAECHNELKTLEFELRSIQTSRVLGLSLMWLRKEKEVARRLDRLSRLKQTLQLYLAADHTELLLDSRDKLVSLHSSVSDAAAEKYRRSLVEWLGPALPSSILNDAQEIRTTNTCKWFLESDSFALWEKEPSSTLWVHGIPGCGKTVLCSAAIEALLTKHETSNTSLLAYYFFVFTAREGNATTQFVRSILAQIALQTKHLPMAFQNLFAKHHEGIQQPTNKALVDALRATLDEIGELFLIIDALDECTSRAGLLRILQKLLDWKIPNLHLMLTSRKEKDIEDVLRDMPQIAVQGKEHHQDIRLFVEQRIESEPSLNKWSTKNQAEITSVVLDQAGDMFRLAALHLDELQRCRNLKGLQRTLYTLPTTLDETYTRILRDLPSEHIQDILRVLTWLCHAWQPPTLTELVAVLAVDLDEARYDYNQEYQDPEDIVGICGGLVVSDSADRRRPVRLSHASVKDYLLSGRFVHENFPDFTFDLHHAEVLICKICLVYLHSHSCERVTEAHNKPPTHALVMYATNFWCEHFRCAGDHSDLLELATKLLTDPSSDFMEWAWVCFILPSSIRTEQQPANLSHSETGRKTLLYISALTGSRSLIDRIIDRGADVNELGGECGTPLAAAVMNADPKTVDYLLERGADVNVQGGLFGNALQIACAFGSIKSVELLLERGANPNIHGGSFETALHAAIYEGCRPEETVKLLLNSGADPQLTKHPSATPLCAALIAGDEASLKALLEAGASVKDDSLITALLWGRLHLADLLLRAGASIKQDNSNVGNAFNAAAIGGVAALKFLVDDWQIDAHVSDREGRTALHAAAFSGSVEAVRFLLDLGLQVDTEDRKGWSSVHYAAMADLPAKLAILLPLWTAKQADWNPLHLACRRNQPEALDLLFNAGLRPSTITTRSPPWQWSLFDVAFSHRNRSLVSPEGKPLHSLLVQDEEEPLDRKPPSGPTQISCDGCQLGERRKYAYEPMFRCTECSDFDYCFMCMCTAEITHTHSSWERRAPLDGSFEEQEPDAFDVADDALPVRLASTVDLD